MSDDEDDDASIGISKYPVMPSLVALQQMKNRLHLARMGKKLMKWRALATGRALRKLALELNSTYAHYKDDVAAAFIALARARFHNENLNNIVLNNVADHASVTIQLGNKNTAGVKLIQHSIVEDNTSPYMFLGIEKGGQVIDEAKKAWLDLLRCMVSLVQERSGFSGLDEAHRNANKREKVLLKLVIPRIKLTIRYIILELEELAREELHRIKMVKHQKISKIKEVSQLPQNLTTDIANEDLNEPLKESLNDILNEPGEHYKVCCKEVNSDDTTSMVEGGFLKKLSDIISLCKNLKSTTCLTSCDNIQQQTLGKYNVLCKEFPEDITEDMKCRLEDLKMHLSKVIGIAEEFKMVASVSPSVEKFVHCCAAVDKKLNLHHVPVGITEEKNEEDIHMEGSKNKINDGNAKTEESIENKNNILKQFNNIVCGKGVSFKSESIDNLLEICENMKNVLTKVISNDEKNKAPYGVNAISRPDITECRNCLEVKDMERNIDGKRHREEGEIMETLQSFTSESCSSNNNDELISELCECCSNNTTPPSVVNLHHHIKSCPDIKNHRETVSHPLLPRDILRHHCPTVIKVPMESTTSKISPGKDLRDDSSDQIPNDSHCCSKTISCNSSIQSIPLEISNCDHSVKIQDTQSSNTSSKLSNRVNAINSNRTQGIKSPMDCKLGYTETRRKKIVVTKRLKSSDGTVTEETVTTTIIKEKYDPTQTHMSDIEDDASPDSTL